MIIAGLTGGIGHGKTTFADLLAAQSRAATHVETWELVAEVATALKHEGAHPATGDINAVNDWLAVLPDILRATVHVQVNYLDIKLTPDRLATHPEYYQKLFEYLQAVEQKPSLADTPLSTETKDEFRALLQWLGGYLVAQVGSGIWYDEILRRITHARRSGNDLATVGGVRYPSDAERLRNSGAIILEITRPNLPSQDSQDITERDRNLIAPDTIIINNGSLTDLATCAQAVYRDLVLRQLKPEYQAA